MSLKIWCPDCNTQTVVDMMSVYDGYEFACDDCKRVFYVRIERGLTPLVPDGFPPSHRDEPFCECSVCMGFVSRKTAAGNANRWADAPPEVAWAKKYYSF